MCVCFLGFSFPCHGPRLTPPAPPPRNRRLLRASVRGAGAGGIVFHGKGNGAGGFDGVVVGARPPPPPPSLITRGHVSPAGMERWEVRSSSLVVPSP